MNVQTLFFPFTAPLLVVLNETVQIAKVFLCVIRDCLQNGSSSAQNLLYLFLRQAVGLGEAGGLAWGNNIVDNVIEQEIQQILWLGNAVPPPFL